MGNYISARTSRKRTGSEASLDEEAGEGGSIKITKRYYWEFEITELQVRRRIITRKCCLQCKAVSHTDI